MKSVLLLGGNLLLLLSLLVACGGGTAENTFPKKVPVDNRSQRQQEKLMSTHIVDFKDLEQERQKIERFLEENGGYYQTKDGADGLVAELTTYYLEEEKNTPLKTRYTYKTGEFYILYWLPNNQVWLDYEVFSFLIEKNAIVQTWRGTEKAQVSPAEQEQVLKLVAEAQKEVSPIQYTF